MFGNSYNFSTTVFNKPQKLWLWQHEQERFIDLDKQNIEKKKGSTLANAQKDGIVDGRDVLKATGNQAIEGGKKRNAECDNRYQTGRERRGPQSANGTEQYGMGNGSKQQHHTDNDGQ